MKYLLILMIISSLFMPLAAEDSLNRILDNMEQSIDSLRHEIHDYNERYTDVIARLTRLEVLVYFLGLISIGVVGYVIKQFWELVVMKRQQNPWESPKRRKDEEEKR